MRTLNRNDQRGMTLAETLSAIGIMTIVLLIVTQIFIINYDVAIKQTSRIDNDVGAVFAVRRISDAARGATAVVASRTINGTAYTTGTDTLILRIPSLDSSSNIIADTYDYIAFYRDAASPTKVFTDTETGSGSARLGGKRLMTAYNQIMAFRYNNATLSSADRVSVYLVNKQTVKGAQFTTQAWTSLFLRNTP
jgi:type II secretory pathway pseudopilin PulG